MKKFLIFIMESVSNWFRDIPTAFMVNACVAIMVGIKIMKVSKNPWYVLVIIFGTYLGTMALTVVSIFVNETVKMLKK